MEMLTIVIFVFILLVVVYFLVNMFSKTSQLTKMGEGKLLQTIKAADIKNPSNSSNYTYSMWLYVDDWNYRFGEKKIVLDRAICPRVVLGDKPNSLQVKIKYIGTGTSGTEPTPYTPDTSNRAANLKNKESCEACEKGFTCACSACDPALYSATQAIPGAYDLPTPAEALAAAAAAASASILTGGQLQNDSANNIHSCELDNVPIQKWFNVIASLYGRTLDLYLDGKLVRTCVLPGVPKVDNNADIQVTPGGGFSGWSSTFKYWANASNPQEAYNIYKAGFGGSILANALNKYKLRISMMKGQKEVGGLEI